MNDYEKPDKVEQTAPSRLAESALGILAAFVRWSWRLCSIGLMLLVLTFIVLGFSQVTHVSTDPHDLAMIARGVIVFAGLVVAWWREWLGGLIVLLAVGVPTGIHLASHWLKFGRLGADEATLGFFILVLPLPILLSWSLHTVKDDRAGPRTRRAALIAAPLLVVAIILCVRAMVHAAGGTKFFGLSG